MHIHADQSNGSFFACHLVCAICSRVMFWSNAPTVGNKVKSKKLATPLPTNFFSTFLESISHHNFCFCIPDLIYCIYSLICVCLDQPISQLDHEVPGNLILSGMTPTQFNKFHLHSAIASISIRRLSTEQKLQRLFIFETIQKKTKALLKTCK